MAFTERVVRERVAVAGDPGRRADQPTGDSGLAIKVGSKTDGEWASCYSHILLATIDVHKRAGSEQECYIYS